MSLPILPGSLLRGEKSFLGSGSSCFIKILFSLLKALNQTNIIDERLKEEINFYHTKTNGNIEIIYFLEQSEIMNFRF